MKLNIVSVSLGALIFLSGCEKALDERVELSMKYPGYTLYEARMSSSTRYLAERGTERFLIRKVEGEFEAVRFAEILFSQPVPTIPNELRTVEPNTLIQNKPDSITVTLDTTYSSLDDWGGF